MSLSIRMGTLQRTHKPLQLIIRIPGGWTAKVPEVKAEEWIIGRYAKAFTRRGIAIEKALHLAKMAVQQCYVHGYANGLRECLSRRAMEYAEMWPEHRIVVGRSRKKPYREIVELRGFDPAKVEEELFIPFQNTGRAGQQRAREVLQEMGARI